MKDAEESETDLKDRFHFVYLTSWILGITILSPWNAIISGV
jgi:hypothetical protein